MNAVWINTSKFTALSLIIILCACSSAPKGSKNPAEEAALQAHAKSVLAAGPTESAKAGGYDAAQFWANRAKTADQYTGHVVKPNLFSETKKAYIVDFKVTFKTHYTAWLNNGLTMADFLSDAGQNHSNSNFKTVAIKEKKAIHAFVKPDANVYQKITDTVYNDFVKKLKDAGYEVIARDQLPYSDMKEYLASDSMIASPQAGSDHTMVYAPTGWKLEKGTFDGPGLGSAFGTTLMKLGEGNSRKFDNGIAIAPAFVVDLGDIKGGKFASQVKVTATMPFAIKYYFGSIDLPKHIVDGVNYTYSAKLGEEDKNEGGRLAASLAGMALGKSMEYSTRDIFWMTPDSSNLQARATEHLGYANDILFEKIRQGRDD